MSKEKERKEFEEIEEIYDIIASDIDINILEGDFDKIDYEFVGIKRAAKEIISEGYRKADEVCKETAKEILQSMNEKMNMLTGCGVPYHVKQFMKEIAEKYNIEADA